MKQIEKQELKCCLQRLGDCQGSLDGYHQEQLPSGEWMVWTDNSFETLTYEDIVKISEVDGVSVLILLLPIRL